MDFLPKVKMEIVVKDDMVHKVIETIENAAKTEGSRWKICDNCGRGCQIRTGKEGKRRFKKTG